MIERYQHKEIAKIWTDENRYTKWLEIEIAACEALAYYSKIPKEVVDRIKSKARINLEKIKILEETTKHEVVAFVNSIVEQIGEDGSFFHYGLTSSDIMDTAFSLTLRDALSVIDQEVDALQGVLKSKAMQYKGLICAGRTHGIHAEPMSFGLKFASWFDELNRHRQRIKVAKENASVCMISGAVGTYSALDPDIELFVAKLLDLNVHNITTQVINRDVYADVFSSLALLGGCMERICVELRNLQRTEVMEVMEEFTKGQTGSSAMPHKRNPVSAENITGCARMLRGYAIMAMENMALWHERDISHSSVERVVGPDATILTGYMLRRLRGIIDRLNVTEKNVNKNLEITHGLVYSSLVLVELMGLGIRRDTAYSIVQKNSMKLWELIEQGQDKHFMDILLSDSELVKLLDKEKLAKIFQKENVLKHTDLIYRRVFEEANV